MTTQRKVQLTGPYALSRATILQMVSKTSPGAYVLSRSGNTAHYVGRSDVNLRDRLLDYVNSTYQKFWFAYATSPRDAFEKECELFHDFNPLDNRIHPQRPVGCGWRCPRCSVYN